VELHPEYGLLQRRDPDVADLVALILSQKGLTSPTWQHPG
jgi:hypothetical protein